MVGNREEQFEFFDDTTCFNCNKLLPVVIQEGTPEDRGYCSVDCEKSFRDEAKEFVRLGLYMVGDL